MHTLPSHGGFHSPTRWIVPRHKRGLPCGTQHGSPSASRDVRPHACRPPATPATMLCSTGLRSVCTSKCSHSRSGSICGCGVAITKPFFLKKNSGSHPPPVSPVFQFSLISVDCRVGGEEAEEGDRAVVIRRVEVPRGSVASGTPPGQQLGRGFQNVTHNTTSTTQILVFFGVLGSQKHTININLTHNKQLLQRFTPQLNCITASEHFFVLEVPKMSESFHHFHL